MRNNGKGIRFLSRAFIYRELNYMKLINWNSRCKLELIMLEARTGVCIGSQNKLECQTSEPHLVQFVHSVTLLGMVHNMHHGRNSLRNVCLHFVYVFTSFWKLLSLNKHSWWIGFTTDEKTTRTFGFFLWFFKLDL